MPAGFAAIVGTTAVADATALTGFAEAVAGGAELAGAAAGAGIAAADLGAGAADVGGGLGAAVTGDVGAGIAPDITGTFATEGGAAFTPTAADITGTVSGIAGGATPATAADLTGTFGQTFSQMGGFGPLTGGGADLTGTLGTAGQALGQGAGLSAPGVPTTTPALTGTAATAPAPSVAGAAPIAAPAPAPPPAPAGLDPNLVNPDVAARDFTVAGNYAPSAPPAGPPTPAENLDQLYGSPWTGAPTVPQAPNIYTPHNLLPDPWHLNPPGVQPGEFISSADPGADPFAGARGMVAGGNTQTDWEAIQAAQGNLTGGGVVSPGDAYRRERDATGPVLDRGTAAKPDNVAGHARCPARHRPQQLRDADRHPAVLRLHRSGYRCGSMAADRRRRSAAVAAGRRGTMGRTADWTHAGRDAGRGQRRPRWLRADAWRLRDAAGSVRG